MVEMFYFLLFYNALDLNNQKILCLPSIYQFERTGTNLDHPKLHTMPCLHFAGFVDQNRFEIVIGKKGEKHLEKKVHRFSQNLVFIYQYHIHKKIPKMIS